MINKDKSCIKRKRSQTQNELKPVENSKNPQSYLEINPRQKEVLFYINCKTIYMSKRILTY